MTINNNNNKSLFAGQNVLKNGQKVYFGFEEVDDQNYDFWRFYAQQASNMASHCNKFCELATKDGYPPFPNKYTVQLKYNEDQYHQIMEFTQKKKYSKNGLFYQIQKGVDGMNQVLQPSVADTKIFMVFASTVLVEKSHDNIKIKKLNNISDYNAFFGDIVMSFVFITEKDAPTVSHYGIFRNPTNFLDITESYKGTSMMLHGFAASVALTQFISKKYMITKPLPGMSEIMCKSLGQGDVHLGTNEDLIRYAEKSEEEKEMLVKYPPIYHIDQNTRGVKIALKEVDLSKHLTTLPNDKAEFIAAVDKKFDFSGHTMGVFRTVVNLQKLASFYSSKSDDV